MAMAGSGGIAGGAGEAEDAYERLLSEYVRIEEAAIAAGKGTGDGTGATTFLGRQLETFIGELDSGVDLGTRAGDIYEALRARLRKAAAEARRAAENAMAGEGDENAGGESAGPAEPVCPKDEGAFAASDERNGRRPTSAADGAGPGSKTELGDEKRGPHPPIHAAGTHNLMTRHEEH
jgi:hypothetical protein